MIQRTGKIRTAVHLATLAVLAMALGGCSTYYQSYYPDSGVYYGDSGGYGQAAGFSRGGYGPVNPVDYPYWSLDYFYFSQYYHPYSVYVGYNEPLYYPYPGWALGYYRPIRSHGSFAFGFGYPWHGYGYRYPAYSFGFFSGYDPFYYGGHYGRDYRRDRHGHHRLRQIDRRLEALQRGDSYASRRDLLGHDRVARSAVDGIYDRRDSNATRSQSRADLLRQRSAGNSPAPQRRTAVPDRRAERRAPDMRSERRPDRRVMDRDRIRRDGDGTAYEGHRGIPIESLRGRVIVNSRNSRSDDRVDRDARRDRNGAARTIRRAPANDWNSDKRQSRQASGRVSRGADNAARGNPSNLRNRSFDPPQPRSNRRAAPPTRSARDISRPDGAPSRSSSTPSRRATMGNRSSDARARDIRRDNRRNKRR